MPTAESITNAADRRVAILELIAASVRDRGFPPTVSELAESTNVSRKMVHLDLGVLVESGRITRLPGSPRGITLVNVEPAT